MASATATDAVTGSRLRAATPWQDAQASRRDEPGARDGQVCEIFPAEVLGAPNEGGLPQGDFRILVIGHGATQDGRRYYGRQVLERAVTDRVFDGARMFLNHADPVSDARRGHRDVRDYCATIQPGSLVVTDRGLEGVCHVHSPQLREMLADPIAREHVGISHDSFIRYRTRQIDGRELQAVETITKCNSVDWVPSGNARGRVVETEREELDMDLEAIGSAVAEALREALPEAVEAAVSGRLPAAVDDAVERRVREAVTAAETSFAEKLAQAVEGAVEQRVSEAVPEFVDKVREVLAGSKEGDAPSEPPAEEAATVEVRESDLTPEIEELKRQNRQLREELDAEKRERLVRETERQLARIVESADGLTRAGRTRVMERFAGQCLPPEELEEKAAEALDEERAHEAEVLRERGVRTRVSGAGASGEGSSEQRSRESYDRSLEEFWQRQGFAADQIDRMKGVK